MQGIGICLMSMRLIDIHLVGVDPIGVYLLQGGLWIILLRNDLCAKLPRTRIRLALIRPRNRSPDPFRPVPHRRKYSGSYLTNPLQVNLGRRAKI